MQRCIDVVLDFFFQAGDGIRDLVRSRGLGDVYKRQALALGPGVAPVEVHASRDLLVLLETEAQVRALSPCLLYTSDAADDLLCVDLGGRRTFKKRYCTLHYLSMSLLH